jgi:hypothetical protein
MPMISIEDAYRITEDLDDLPQRGDDELEDDDEKPRQHSFLTAGGLRGCRAALVFALIEIFVPPEQCWLYYTIMVHILDDLDLSMLGWSLISSLLMWYMIGSPSISYFVCIAFDHYFHPGRYEKDDPKISVMHYLGCMLLFKLGSYVQLLTPWIPFFGGYRQEITLWIRTSLGVNGYWTSALLALLSGLPLQEALCLSVPSQQHYLYPKNPALMITQQTLRPT